MHLTRNLGQFREDTGIPFANNVDASAKPDVNQGRKATGPDFK